MFCYDKKTIICIICILLLDLKLYKPIFLYTTELEIRNEKHVQVTKLTLQYPDLFIAILVICYFSLALAISPAQRPSPASAWTVSAVEPGNSPFFALSLYLSFKFQGGIQALPLSGIRKKHSQPKHQTPNANTEINMADVLDLDQTEEFEVDDDGDRKSLNYSA